LATSALVFLLQLTSTGAPALAEFLLVKHKHKRAPAHFHAAMRAQHQDQRPKALLRVVYGCLGLEHSGFRPLDQFPKHSHLKSKSKVRPFSFSSMLGWGAGGISWWHHSHRPSSPQQANLLAPTFKNPFFLWLIQILKAVAVVMATAIIYFWSFMRNPAIGAKTGARTGLCTAFCRGALTLIVVLFGPKAPDKKLALKNRCFSPWKALCLGREYLT
jgi:hypothetical protein